MRWVVVAALLSSASVARAEGSADFVFGIIKEMAKSQERGRRAAPPAARRAVTTWLVIASREDPQEAVALAESYAPMIGPTAVIQSRNGRYAVVAGTLNRDKAKPNLEARKAMHIIPQDSFLSDGQNLDRVVWNSFDGDGSLDLMTRPVYRQSIQRLQAALSRLGLYHGPVDGLIGPSTGVAFSAYVDRYGLPFGEVVDTYTLSSIEQTATDGFRSNSERSLAQARGFQDAATYQQAEAGGFPSATAFSEARTLGFQTQRDWDQATSGGFRRGDEFVRARAGGFATASEYRSAQVDGFDTAREHEAFRRSGFTSSNEFREAQAKGFSDKSAYQRAEADALKAARREATDLLSDADAFLRLNPQTPNLLDIAAEAATLKGGMASASATDLAATALRLRTALSQAPAFAVFEAARGEERVREAAARRIALQTELETTRGQMAAWVAANLASPKLPGVVAELKLLTDDAKSDDLDVLSTARDRAIAAVQKQGLASEIALLTRKDTAVSNGAGTLPQAVSITAANAVLLQGPPDDVVVLYNTSPRAPSLARNLVGAFTFRTGQASLCLHGLPQTPALERALASELERFDGRAAIISASPCGPMDVANRDLLLIQRRAFLAAPPSIALPFLEALETASLRVFDVMPFRDVAKRMDEERLLSDTIRDDVANERRNDYGALMLATGKAAICATVSEDRGAHDEMLSRISSYAATEISQRPMTRFASLDETFLAAKAEECRLVYGSEHALKLLADGLKRDGRAASFLPLWYERKSLEENVAGLVTARQEALRQAEERRVAAEGERSVAQRAADAKAQTRGAREADLRSRYGAEAAALLNRFSEGLKRRMIAQPGVVLAGDDEKASAEIAALFPAVENWRRGLPAQDWQPTAVDLTIADYGMARWDDRALEAIAMEARVRVVSQERGRYDEACFLIAAIVDGEFLRYRDPFEAPCDDDVAELDRWKVGHQLESRWLAP
ncbi:hypothetical protein ACLNGM_04595 [Aureimonas phyllosphaerae]